MEYEDVCVCSWIINMHKPPKKMVISGRAPRYASPTEDSAGANTVSPWRTKLHCSRASTTVPAFAGQGYTQVHPAISILTGVPVVRRGHSMIPMSWGRRCGCRGTSDVQIVIVGLWAVRGSRRFPLQTPPALPYQTRLRMDNDVKRSILGQLRYVI